MIAFPWALVAKISAVLLVLWLVYDYGGDVREDGIKAQYLEYLQIASDRVAEIDAQGVKRLGELKNENDSLRNAVTRGNVQLRVAAKCPSVTASTGLDNGEAPELNATARSAYFALREGIGRQFEQLNACQAILSEERGHVEKLPD